jgi:hypothetical protein
MRFRSLILAFFVAFASACTTSITSVEQVYPAILSAPQGAYDMSQGTSVGFGASAMIFGRDQYGAGDSISVNVSNPLVVRVTSEFTVQSRCVSADGIPALCLQRNLRVDALKMGEATITFKVGSRADTLRVTVTQGKG